MAPDSLQLSPDPGCFYREVAEPGADAIKWPDDDLAHPEMGMDLGKISLDFRDDPIEGKVREEGIQFHRGFPFGHHTDGIGLASHVLSLAPEAFSLDVVTEDVGDRPVLLEIRSEDVLLVYQRHVRQAP